MQNTLTPEQRTAFLDWTKDMQIAIRNNVMEQMKSAEHNLDSLAQVEGKGEGDVSLTIDLPAKRILHEESEKMGKKIPFVLISEDTGVSTYPIGIPEEDCMARVIVDPMDGSRESAYNKSSSYVLTGVAPNKGANTMLSDIEVAVQTEIPTTKQYRADIMYAVKGDAPVIEEWDVLKGEWIKNKYITPSGEKTIENGFAPFVNYFRGGSVYIAQVREELFQTVLGDLKEGVADVFDEQYIASAGHMARLMLGQYRFVADLRPWTERILAAQGKSLGLCAHPYDVCTKSIAEAAGIIITDLKGKELDAPLDTSTNVGWVGYPNKHIRRQVEPVLLEILERQLRKYIHS